ncbi:MAG: DNA-protecting protein DprA [Mucilaginibacter polytrichastri]|nr:DNA-protecting protein DprA [Mucilaginibacter polytrichastri]
MSQLHQIALTLLPHIGPATARAMLAYCGSAEAIFSTSKNRLLAIPGIGRKTAEALRKDAALFARAEQELLFAEKERVSLLFLGDAAYPKRLRNCIDAPVLLYFKGSADLNAPRIVSVVGTRACTDYGRELTDQFVRELADKQVSVISGLAYGIDIAAHRACVKYQVPTIGVLAHGLDRLYPQQHLPTARKMMENGGLISDFMSGTNPDRENFPQRNRIIAGLADATVVVEAGEKGGALITADIAHTYNREVFAFPGPVNSAASAGCHAIIRRNKAALITSAADLCEAMSWTENIGEKGIQMELRLDLAPAERAIMNVLNQPLPTAVDDLALKTGLSLAELASSLLSLEMQGLILSLPGKMYRRTR